MPTDQSLKSATPQINTSRLPLIDWLRGLSIILMVIYHFCYDLDFFGYIDTAFGQNWWIPFRYVIVIGFLSLVGVSLVITHKPTIKWANMNKRSLQLLIACVFVSGSGYFIAAHKITVFGILQFILISSWLALPFIKKPVLALCLGLCVFILGHTFTHSIFDSVWLHWIGMAENIRPALDYVPLFPWFGVVLIGVFVGHWFMSAKGQAIGKFSLANHSSVLIAKSNRLIEVMGQHSLIIYLVHQPLMFGIFYLLELV